MARQNLLSAQDEMKDNFDLKAVERHIQARDKVLVLLPVQGNPLQVRFCGPYVTDRKVREFDYLGLSVIPDWRKTKQQCHVNMIKQYHERQGSTEKIIPKGAISNEKCEDTMTHTGDTIKDGNVPECFESNVVTTL